MKTFFTFITALLFSILLQAQPNEVSLVVTGEGATKEEATNNALRSAIEQAFGVFVSANTEILNDEIVNILRKLGVIEKVIPTYKDKIKVKLLDDKLSKGDLHL